MHPHVWPVLSNQAIRHVPYSATSYPVAVGWEGGTRVSRQKVLERRVEGWIESTKWAAHACKAARGLIGASGAEQVQGQQRDEMVGECEEVDNNRITSIR